MSCAWRTMLRRRAGEPATDRLHEVPFILAKNRITSDEHQPVVRYGRCYVHSELVVSFHPKSSHPQMMRFTAVPCAADGLQADSRRGCLAGVRR